MAKSDPYATIVTVNEKGNFPVALFSYHYPTTAVRIILETAPGERTAGERSYLVETEKYYAEVF
jgi:hypothetical protein